MSSSCCPGMLFSGCEERRRAQSCLESFICVVASRMTELQQTWADEIQQSVTTPSISIAFLLSSFVHASCMYRWSCHGVHGPGDFFSCRADSADTCPSFELVQPMNAGKNFHRRSPLRLSTGLLLPVCGVPSLNWGSSLD